MKTPSYVRQETIKGFIEGQSEVFPGCYAGVSRETGKEGSFLALEYILDIERL